MDKQAIIDAAVCAYSEEDECFVVESPLFEPIAGVGDTEEEARQCFLNLLEDACQAHLEGRLVSSTKTERTYRIRVEE